MTESLRLPVRWMLWRQIAHLGDLNGGELAAACGVGELRWLIAHLGDLNGRELAAACEVGDLRWQIGQASQTRLWADPIVF